MILNIATNLLFGAGIALVVRQSRAMRQDFLCWQLLFLTAFEALVFTPLSTYLFRFYPQWSMLYAFDPQLFPDLDHWLGLLSAAAVLLNFAAAVGGFALARAGILAGRTWLWSIPLAVGAAVWLIVLIFFGDRVVCIGDFDTFWQGNALTLVRRLPGWVAIAMYSATVGFTLWVGRRFGNHDPTLL